MNNKTKDIQLEKIPLLVLYKEGKTIKTEMSNNTTEYEIFGFLKNYVERLEDKLYFEQVDNWETEE